AVRATTIGFDGIPVHMDTEYDSSGRTLRVSNPYKGSYANNGWTENVYDLLGRSKAIILPDGTSGGTTTYNGYETTTTNALNHAKTEVRNVLGELVRVTDNIGGTIDYQYDLGGNLLSATTD